MARPLVSQCAAQLVSVTSGARQDVNVIGTLIVPVTYSNLLLGAVRTDSASNTILHGVCKIAK